MMRPSASLSLALSLSSMWKFMNVGKSWGKQAHHWIMLNNGFFGQHDVVEGGTFVEQKMGFQFCTEQDTEIQRMYVSRCVILVEGTNSFFPLNFNVEPSNFACWLPLFRRNRHQKPMPFQWYVGTCRKLARHFSRWNQYNRIPPSFLLCVCRCLPTKAYS